MTFGPARPGDGAAILRIFKDTFEAELLPCVPLGASGAETFLEDTIGCKLPNPDTVWMVARDNGVRAFAGVRVLPASLFLNYLHVDPAFHGQRVGSNLLRHCLERLAFDANSELWLDVDEKNRRAKAWYERLGFLKQSTAIWKTFRIEPAPHPHKFTLSSIPHTVREQATYGFSNLTVTTALGSFQVGRLGTRYFRSTEKEILNRLPVLHGIDPTRDLLLITPDETDGGAVVSRRERMKASVRQVLEKLPKE